MKREFYWVGYTAMMMLKAWGVNEPTLPAKGERMVLLFPRVLRDGTEPTFKHAEIVWSDKRNDCGERLWHCVASDEVPGGDTPPDGYEDGEIVVRSFTRKENENGK